MAEYLQVLLSLMHSALLPDEKLIDPPDPGGHLLNTALSQMCCLMSPPPHKSVSPLPTSSCIPALSLPLGAKPPEWEHTPCGLPSIKARLPVGVPAMEMTAIQSI